tara:strand:- start:178 stop:648 length:471 start_codon:yes stop_codon:yes gene_type:complete
MKVITFESKRIEKKNLNLLMDISHNKQLQFINMTYMNEDFDEKKKILIELNKKINGYKQQDIKKNIHDADTLINKDDLIEKLVESKLKCKYCKNNIYIFFKHSREKEQWTLDRIDNNEAHTNDNTVISCLKCNLERRTKDYDIYIFSKQLKIKKTE